MGAPNFYQPPEGYTGGAVNNADYLPGSNQYFTKYSPEDTENMVWVAASPVGAVALLGVGILGLAIINSKNKKAKWPSSGPSMPNMDASKAAEKGQTAESAQGADSQTTPATPPLPPLPPDDDGNKKKENEGETKKSSKYEDVTKNSRGKSSIENRLADTSPKEAGRTLQENGFKKTMSKDGTVEIYTKPGSDVSYTIRQVSSSKPSRPTIDVFKNGNKVKEIRLEP